MINFTNRLNMQINHPFESSSSNEIRRSFCSSFCPARLSRPSTKSSSSDSSSPGEQVGAKKNNINITLFRTVGFRFHTRAWKVCKVSTRTDRWHCESENRRPKLGKSAHLLCGPNCEHFFPTVRREAIVPEKKKLFLTNYS